MPPETEDERRRRLRKDERRHLRVSFRPDDSLTEIHIFTHDPDEEISSEDVVMRDAGDLRSEGQALKMHMDQHMEDDENGEGDLFDYYTPTGIDDPTI